MAARPEIGGVPNYYPWATTSITQAVSSEGEVLLKDNKAAPLPEHTAYGLVYDEPPNYQETNYQYQGYSEWFEHLDGRYKVGSTHLTTTSETEAQISARLGGTWVLLGSESPFGQTMYYYGKTE